jgi:hypothetical protein
VREYSKCQLNTNVAYAERLVRKIQGNVLSAAMEKRGSVIPVTVGEINALIADRWIIMTWTKKRRPQNLHPTPNLRRGEFPFLVIISLMMM